MFDFKPQTTRPYEYPNIVLSIAIEASLNLKIIERTNYSVLDLLADVGGLEQILLSFVSILLSVFNYNNRDNHLVS